MRNFLNTPFFAIFLSVSPTMLCAATMSSEEHGRNIAKEMVNHFKGYGDQSMDMEMELIASGGQKTFRKLKVKSLEVSGDGDKSLMSFEEPKDIAGTSFLSYTHLGKPDDQWLYLPSLKRVKRLSSNDQSGSFMASEFAYEDLASPEVDRFTYKYLREEKFDGKNAFVVERVPTDRKSGYTRHLVWIEKGLYRPLKIVYFDRKDVELKQLLYKEFVEIKPGKWRPTVLEMSNVQNQRSTILRWQNVKFNTGLTAQMFEPKALEQNL